MARYRKKPVVIEAIQWTGKNLDAIKAFMTPIEPAYITGFAAEPITMPAFPHPDELMIPTLEGVMVASKHDWIIRGVQGELYPCKPDIFAATYEPVEGD